MEKEKIRELLADIRDGKVEIDDALRTLRSLPYEDLGFAKIDTHRDLRKGFPEVILCKGKTIEQITEIVSRISSENDFIMATKASRDVYEAIKRVREDAVYHETARIVLIGRRKRKRAKGVILVVSAGTSDIPIAEEVAVTAETMGNTVERLYDIGVSGVHRLFDSKEKLFSASVIIVVAGMEGALASVVGGLVDKPVIAVPTSGGYGASFDGLAALLSMLNCCAPGVVVVNIDNGFGAGYFASVINQMAGEA
ncbi:MAG TPA: nickel pincer cofactor biosynthesis protein LarB [Candidatus Latescibacteria bacterium]|nr:nickel pincer cofactor biosynthesis protein LarB [Candidatus Latescibacterota bacterium]